MQVEEIPSYRFDQDYDREEPRKQENIQPPSYSRQQTIEQPVQPPQYPQQPEYEMGGFPGLSNQNDKFRQKQAEMKKEMKRDLQNFVQQNQNADPRKQRIQKQRQIAQGTDQWGRAQTFNDHSKHDDPERNYNKRNQVADEVFNEIMQTKSNKSEIYGKPSSYGEYDKESQDNQSHFMFKTSEDEEKQRIRMKKQEYGDILRSQMSSAQNERTNKNRHSNAPNIIDKIGNDYDNQRVKVDKDEYRFALQKQIEEKKLQHQIKKEEMEKEELMYRNQIESVQVPGYDSNKANMEYNKPNYTPVQENQTFARQSTITSQNFKSQESITKKQQYQAELRAQIEEKERQSKLEKQRIKEFEEIEDRRKLEEHNQMISDYRRDEGLAPFQSQGKGIDLGNRNKYFEPSENNPIPSVGIKKVVEMKSQMAQPQIYQPPKPYIQEPQYLPSEDSQRTNPSTIRRNQPTMPPNKERHFNEGLQQATIMHPAPIQPQYPSELYEYPPQQNPMFYGGIPYQNQLPIPPVQNENQVNMMIEEQKKIIQMYQATLQQIIEFQQVIKPKQESPVKLQEYYNPSPPQPNKYMNRAEQSNAALAHELKNLYSELGTMLATKQLEIDSSKSKFVIAENTNQDRQKPSSDEFGYLNAETYKFNSKLDQSLQGSSKFVKIQSKNNDYEQDHFEQSVPIGELVETWNENEFDSKAKLNKFNSHSKQVYKNNEDEIEEDLNIDELDREESAAKNLDKQSKANQSQKHKDLLEARNMLAQAMNEAAFLINKEQDINHLANQSHKEGQMKQVSDINKELDFIEKMIQDDNESNMKRKPMENSISSVKSSIKNSIKNSVIESSKDPFDKLEAIGKELNSEEIEQMRKTAKTNKSQKRKPWGVSNSSKPPNRTDYNQQIDDVVKMDEDLDVQSSLQVYNNKTEQNLDDDQEEITQPIQKSAGIRKSGRYDCDFENTKEQKIYETPDPQCESRGIDIDQDKDEMNIANSNKSSGIFMDNDKAFKIPAKTQANFNKGSLDNKDEDNHSIFSDPNHLNRELWKQNFEALKTSYLKLMGEANRQTMRPGQYKFGDSDEEEEESYKAPEAKRPVSNKVQEKPYKKTLAQQIIDDTANQYEQYRNAFKAEDPTPIVIKSPTKTKRRGEETKQSVLVNEEGDIKEISMNNPKYGNINSSISCLDENLMKTNNNDKSINIEVDSFNWEEEELKKSQAKINLAQYDNEDKEDQYEDDFENDAKSDNSSPKKNISSPIKNIKEQHKAKDNFTNEEEQIMDECEFKVEEEKMTTLQKQKKIEYQGKPNSNNFAFASKESNKINEYLSNRNEKGNFPVDEILASRAQKLQASPNVVDPFKKMMKSKNNKPMLKSYKDVRTEKQMDNLQKQIDDRILNCDNAMIDKLSKLMNQFEIGESMPVVGDLYQIPEANEQPEENNIYDYQNNKFLDDITDLDQSQITNNENPFTKLENFLAFHSQPDEQRNIEAKITTESKEEFIDFPQYIKNRSSSGTGILRPLSSKQSNRYSKNN